MSENPKVDWTVKKADKIAREKLPGKRLRTSKKKDRKKGKKARRDEILAIVHKVKEQKTFLDRNKGKKGTMISISRDLYNHYKSTLKKALLQAEKDEIEIDDNWRSL